MEEDYCAGTSIDVVHDEADLDNKQLDLDDQTRALRTLPEFNDAACDPDHCDPSTTDGLATRG